MARSPGRENCYRLQIGLIEKRLDYREVGPWHVEVWVDHAAADGGRPVEFWPTSGRVAGTGRRGWAALCAVLGIPPYAEKP